MSEGGHIKTLISKTGMYVYIYICVCVCVICIVYTKELKSIRSRQSGKSSQELAGH